MARHSYILGAAIVLLILFLVYAFVIDHKVDISDDFSPDGWTVNLKKVGLSEEQISKIQHDDTAWYYDGTALCVGYGDNDELCPRSENYCAGGKTFGTIAQQAKAIKEAIDSNREHKMCPLLYPSTN